MGRNPSPLPIKVLTFLMKLPKNVVPMVGIGVSHPSIFGRLGFFINKPSAKVSHATELLAAVTPKKCFKSSRGRVKR